ncbi:MAG: class I SAM-dependent methyltransferase, partial [Maricaulaceae bacterium]
MSFKTGSSAHAIDIDVQRRYWDRWNAEHREKNQVFTSRRQADIVVGWLRRLGRSDLEMLDVGCGSGWLADRLIEFGAVTGTDLAPDVLERAKSRLPNATFVSGDFMELEFEEEGFDVVVGLEALS